MSEQLYTHAGTKFFISDAPVNAKGNIVVTDFASTNWIEVRGLYDLGTLGGEQTINEWELLGEEWTRKTKGGRNGGTMTNTFIPMALDPGQVKFREAIESCRPYQFKIERGADCAPESNVTISIAEPGVITWNNHGFLAGQPVTFSDEEGELPTGLVADTMYYVVSDGLTDNEFSVSAEPGGTPIDTTGTSTGTIVATAPPAGMAQLFQGLATEGEDSGGDKNALYTVTFNVAVDGRVLRV